MMPGSPGSARPARRRCGRTAELARRVEVGDRGREEDVDGGGARPDGRGEDVEEDLLQRGAAVAQRSDDGGQVSPTPRPSKRAAVICGSRKPISPSKGVSATIVLGLGQSSL